MKGWRTTCCRTASCLRVSLCTRPRDCKTEIGDRSRSPAGVATLRGEIHPAPPEDRGVAGSTCRAPDTLYSISLISHPNVCKAEIRSERLLEFDLRPFNILRADLRRRSVVTACQSQAAVTAHFAESMPRPCRRLRRPFGQGHTSSNDKADFWWWPVCYLTVARMRAPTRIEPQVRMGSQPNTNCALLGPASPGCTCEHLVHARPTTMRQENALRL